MKKRNCLIDIFRFVLCVTIIFIHCPLPGVFGQLIFDFGRCAVPFFLLVSGWFSYHPDKATMTTRARKKLLDTFKLLGVFLLAYLVMNSLACILNGNAPYDWIFWYTDLQTLTNLLLYNRATFFGSTGYYPFMLIYVYAIFMLLVKTNALKKSFYIIPALLLYNVLAGKFSTLRWFHYGNFLFTGLPFFLLGHLMRTKAEALGKYKPAFWLCLFIAGTLLSFIESYAIQPAYCFVGSILMAVSLFMYSLSSPLVVKKQAFVDLLYRCSIYIFILHCGIRDILTALLKLLHITCPDSVFPFVVVLVSLLISLLWDQLATKLHREKA